MLERSISRLSPAALPATRLVAPRAVLERTVLGLRNRSAGWRESACVWSGSRDEVTHIGRVARVTFHHDVADDRATALSLELSESAKFTLYQRLASSGETLLALLHTHPNDWVGLSEIDMRNQLGSRIGFWSIVLPHYAARDADPRVIGFHVRCQRGWQQLSDLEASERFHIVESP